jgi:hypothetical protein
MPTRPAEIRTLLQAKQADFKNFDVATLGLLQQYRTAFRSLPSLDPAQESALIESLAIAAPPTSDSDNSNGSSILRFPHHWQNREASFSWVREVLTGVRTFAVDGSQIYPSKDISIPVALVQIGWFENPHQSEGHYEKDIRLDLMTPLELREFKGEMVDRQVNMRRFQMETQRLVEYIEEHERDENCLVLLDGSLVATFSEAFDQETQVFYVDCLLRLLQASDRCRVPLVAYIDTSYALDLLVLLQRCFDLPPLVSAHDAQLVNSLMAWGDRTPLFRCQREILGKFYGPHKDRIDYTYLKTNDGYPARLELPAWIREAGRLEQVLDWVRGEVVIGGGYPYAIETADQVAVLRQDDRNAFYRILQDWSEQAGVEMRLSRKMVSKVRRR